MSTLHDRIRAVVEKRLRLAREATAGPWESSGPDTIAEWSIYATKRGWMVATASVNSYPSSESPRLRGGITGDEANRNAAHIAANDPADAILGAEHALWILEEHAIVHRDIGWLRFDGDNFEETYGEIPVCGKCVPKHSHFRTRNAVPEGPCSEVRRLATRWRVEVDG